MRQKEGIAERVAAPEAKVAEVQRLAAAELARQREEYGDDLERVVAFRREIAVMARRSDLNFAGVRTLVEM